MNTVSKFTPKLRPEKSPSSNPDLAKKKDTVQVFCRLRPLEDDHEPKCIKLLSSSVLSLTTPADSRGVRKEVHAQFQHIFTSYALQKEIFDAVAYPLLVDLLHGKNGLLFTYGVTGSGKTYTLTGDRNNPGLIPKCIYTLFNTISEVQALKCTVKSDRMNGFEVQSLQDALQDQLNSQKPIPKTPKRNTTRKPSDKSYLNDGTKILNFNKNNLYSVFVSYVEIYNNTVYDLLDESNGKTPQSKIVREDSQKNMYVNGAVETEVKSAEETFEIFSIGQKNKKMGNTVLNSVSSRSHSIFNIRIVQSQRESHDVFLGDNGEGRRLGPYKNLLKISQLSLVDLAGSERTNRTQNTGLLLKESSRINNSLLTLRTCLEILRENQTTGSNRLVPYRDSRLTLLFKNYFEGEGTVTMMVCVNPSAEDLEENLQVMKFAETTRDVKVARTEPKFTPGKKKIQKMFATPLAHKNIEMFDFGPELPKFNLLRFNSLEESQAAIDNLLNTLQTRQQKIKALDQELTRKEINFRSRCEENESPNAERKEKMCKFSVKSVNVKNSVNCKLNLK